MSIGSNSYASETSQSPQIFVRLRPPLRSELKLTSESLGAVSIPGPSTVRISQTDYSKDFTFTSVFPEFTPQAEVFEHSALPLVHHVLNGYNGVYFVYGQTGTGKTHTMGTLTKMTVSSQGVIPQSLDYIFRYIEANQSADCSFEVRVSFYQIYLDAIQDLLNPENKNTARAGCRAATRRHVQPRAPRPCRWPRRTDRPSTTTQASRRRALRSGGRRRRCGRRR